MRRSSQPAGVPFSDAISRRIYKFIYKHSHPRSHRHNRLYWPHYRVERNSQGELERIHFKGQLVVDNTQLECNHNKTCMLVATGPSIRNVNRECFHRSDIDYVGVNGSISLEDVDFSYYVIIDYNFTRNRFDLVEKVLGTRCTLFTIPRCLDLVLRRVEYSRIRCRIKVVELVCEGQIERFFGPKEQVDISKDHFYEYRSFWFSTHIHDAVFDYFTVTYVALQVVCALKYKKIYIAGLDMNNFSQPRFYEGTDNKQSTMLDQYSTVILPAFDAAAMYFQTNNIQAFNLSAASAVQSFEKIAPHSDCLSDRSQA